MKLQMKFRDAFIEHFIKVFESNNKDIKLMAEDVWELLNDYYSKGYNRGKNDPDYERDDDDDKE